jgi:hypothetical protein
VGVCDLQNVISWWLDRWKKRNFMLKHDWTEAAKRTVGISRYFYQKSLALIEAGRITLFHWTGTYENNEENVTTCKYPHITDYF